MSSSVPLAVSLVVIVLGACAPRTYVLDSPARPALASGDARVLAQLDGHLDRARECLRISGSGLVEARLRIEPDGRVRAVQVLRNTSGEAAVSRCVQSRLGQLYFDPAPARTVARTVHLATCEAGSAGSCRLGPVHAPDGTPIDARLTAGVRALEKRIVACATEVAPNRVGLVSVELTVGSDGRVASGWVRHASAPALRLCGVRPLLGLPVVEAPAAPQRVRFSLGLGPSRQPLASR